MDDSDRERWRGRVDAMLQYLENSIKSAQAKVDGIDTAQRLLELRVNTVATKIGIYASIGACLGGGITSVIVGLFLKH